MPITVSIATIFDRIDSLRQVLESIVNKVDKINIYAHRYIPTELPEVFLNEF